MIQAWTSDKIAKRPFAAEPQPLAEASQVASPAPLVQWQGHIIDSGAAWLKSSEILVRGMNVWNAAFLGVVSVSLDDQRAARQARLSCRTLDSRLCLERDLAPRALSDAFARLTVLTRIALHLGEDACYPLQRHSVVLLEALIDRPAP